eukprot:m.276372 g.276372  ORF g.276372 m.276372 type:complete len:57 (-) comp22865_c3_seq6:602-772(-)
MLTELQRVEQLKERIQNLKERIAEVKAELAAEQDPEEKAALKKRLRTLEDKLDALL